MSSATSRRGEGSIRSALGALLRDSRLAIGTRAATFEVTETHRGNPQKAPKRGSTLGPAARSIRLLNQVNFGALSELLEDMKALPTYPWATTYAGTNRGIRNHP